MIRPRPVSRNSCADGVGTVPGALIGGLIMARLSTGLQMLNATPAITYVSKSAVLVSADLLGVYFKRNKSYTDRIFGGRCERRD